MRVEIGKGGERDKKPVRPDADGNLIEITVLFGNFPPSLQPWSNFLSRPYTQPRYPYWQ